MATAANSRMKVVQGDITKLDVDAIKVARTRSIARADADASGVTAAKL